ncbi:MAG: S8 family serine peptidase, partial [Pseudomonadota bacterium]
MSNKSVKRRGFDVILAATCGILLLTAGAADAVLRNNSDEERVANTSTSNSGASQPQMQVVRSFANPEKSSGLGIKFIPEDSLDDAEYLYIVELKQKPLAQNNTFIGMRNDRIRYQQSTATINQMRQDIIRDQDAFLQSVVRVMGTKKPIHRYEFALNGFTVRMTQDEAKVMAQMDEVVKITRDQVRRLETDRGPTLIGAPTLWNGQIPNIPSTQGEGIIVGVLDSGINSDHPSFAAVSGDGYVHTNPLGDGVFIGDCANASTDLCNNKLIGIRSYPTITDVYSDLDVFPPNLPRIGEDYDGHGSHVTAIAAGNVLLNQPEILPEANTEESDGVEGVFSFEQISGVAPRANIIAYQVCFPGEPSNNDTYAGCLTSVINDAIDDAIMDGVDVINFSISGGGDPWRDSTERAFLNALSAGIFVAVSAGNSGPGPFSSEKSAPWYTAVAASEHGRENGFVKEINNFSGGVSPPPVLIGRSNTSEIRAPIVFAGDFANPNDPDNDPAQCLQPYPQGTFNGQIVVCDRGEIARVEKAENVAAGGAGGYVLANIDGGTTFLADDVYVVPGIHIKAEEGNALKEWLSAGTEHMATITGAQPSQFIDNDRVDVVANFSSRGPNRDISTLTPTMSAPGVNIYSAFADQSFGKDGDVPPSAGDFSYLQGTSMSSPHVAGAAALVMAANPTWTVDQVRSALSMTATPNMRLDDEVTNADHFDMGAGRVQVDQAAQVGLLMNITTNAYIVADPQAGGDPRALNMPSITDDNCRAVCTWSREFVATRDGSWQASAENVSGNLSIAISPSSFSLQQG